MKRTLAVLLLLALAPVEVLAQSEPVILATVPFGIDVTRNLRENNMATGGGVTGNATKLNAALLDRANNYAFHFPAGGFSFTDTIEAPNRASYAILGAGTGRNGAEEQYSSGFGGNCTRWLWKGAEGGTMLSVPGWGAHLDGIRFEGNPSNGIDGVTRAGIGIHYVAASTQTAPTSSSMRIGWITIDGADCGIFCGHDKTLAASPDGTSGVYTGHDYVGHADTSNIDRLDLRAIQQAGFWTANEQSVQHEIGHIEAVGFASATVPVVKAQRGGGIHVGYLQALNNCTFFEIDRLGNTATVTLDAWGADAQARDICLVRFNTGPIPNRVSRAEVNIGPGEVQDWSYTGPLEERTSDTAGIVEVGEDHGLNTSHVVDVFWTGGQRLNMPITAVAAEMITVSGGSGDNLPAQTTELTVRPHRQQYLIDTGTGGKDCVINLYGVRGLRANSFKLNGFAAGGTPALRHVCVVNLNGCEIVDGSTPRTLVDESGGASTTLWQLNWFNCTDRQETASGATYANLPITNGSAKGGSMPP